MHRAQRLIARLLRHPDDRSTGKIVNHLINEFWSGYPATALRPLLHSDDVNIQQAALFILGELGHKARSLRDELPHFLAHPMPYAKVKAIEAALVATVGDPEDGPIVASALALLDDPNESVRQRAVWLLLAAIEPQLRSALNFLDAVAGGSPHGSALQWLLSGPNADEMILRLRAPSRLERLYALAAARRIADFDPEPLRQAHTASDEELRSCAELADQVCEVLAAIRRRECRSTPKA